VHHGGNFTRWKSAPKIPICKALAVMEKVLKKISLILIFVLGGCSITYSPVDDLGEGKYKITTYGNAFSTQEDLQIALNEKATKTCGENNYDFLQNDLKITSGDFYAGGVSPISMTSGTVYAIVQCKK
jgi:hypothetical protein